jgi:hypothetical protein
MSVIWDSRAVASNPAHTNAVTVLSKFDIVGVPWESIWSWGTTLDDQTVSKHPRHAQHVVTFSSVPQRTLLGLINGVWMDLNCNAL